MLRDDGHVPRRPVGGQGREVPFDRPVLQGVVGQHHDPPTKHERTGRSRQEPLQGSQLIVDLDPESLKGTFGGMPRRAPGRGRDGIGDDIHQST